MVTMRNGSLQPVTVMQSYKLYRSETLPLKA
jgi:hypothetical protein